MERLTGIGVSSGIAVGPALVAIQRTQVIRFPIGPDRVARELAALERARARSEEQLRQIRTRIAELKGADLAAIFDAQILILDDPMLLGRAAALVRDERVNAEWAVQQALDEIALVFDGIADPYLHERKGDLHDVAGRLRMNLREGKGSARDLLQDLDAPCVLVADELTPSVVAQLDWTRILGFATDAGSRTYHTAILARSLGVPAVVGLHDVSVRVPPGASVIVDGESGDVVIDPPSRCARPAQARARLQQSAAPAVHDWRGPFDTTDGVRITLQANIERADDVAAAVAAGAEGIGLYRSEFMLVGGPPDMAGEEEQYHVYRQLIERMSPRPVTIRTFDIDERQLARPLVDAALDARWFPDHERSGHAGLRGIRFGLAQPAIFKTQLRALLRAARHGRCGSCFRSSRPLHEVRSAKALVEAARLELDRPRRRRAACAARHHDRGAVGGVHGVAPGPRGGLLHHRHERSHPVHARGRPDGRARLDRYEPLHPAVLRLLRQVRRGAVRRGIPVSVCGEMASDPLLLRLLIGCGLTEFSMTPGALAVARRVVRETSARDMAQHRRAGADARHGPGDRGVPAAVLRQPATEVPSR